MLLVANILQPLIDVAEAVLTFFHDNAGFGWGASIVALTFVTRLVILPLSLKQIRSMRSLQAHAPELKAINEKYKQDPQRRQRELMRFYQENKINPFASCVPLLLQLPVFLALFYLLQGDDFKADVQAEGPVGWLFIDSLVEKESGAALAALIVLFIATQMGASLVMAARVERQQRIIMFALPLVFAPFVATFPAGLAVYWIATNIWTLGQQFLVQRIIPPPPTQTPEGEKRDTKPPPPPPRKKKRRR
jgi:YidC/Oxa1 family membrane protein insertase